MVNLLPGLNGIQMVFKKNAVVYIIVPCCTMYFHYLDFPQYMTSN